VDREPKFANGDGGLCGGETIQKEKYPFGQIGGPLGSTSALPTAVSEPGAMKHI